MYVIRHFGLIAWITARNSAKPRFWLRGLWIWLCLDIVGWSAGLLLWAVPGGRRVECECCGWRGRRFFLHTVLSGSKLHRFKEEVCANCGALKRQRQLVRYLADKVAGSVPTTASILEIGPGRGELKWFERQGLTNVLTADIRPGVAQSLMDITRMALRKDAFDMIVCSHVLEHVPQDLAAMREMRRILKPNGTCVIQVPLDSGLPQTVEYGRPNHEEFDHVRAYGADFQKRLESVGFSVSRSDGEMFEVTKAQ